MILLYIVSKLLRIFFGEFLLVGFAILQEAYDFWWKYVLFKKAFCELCVFSLTVCWSPANILVNRYIVQAHSGHMFCRLENDSEVFFGELGDIYFNRIACGMHSLTGCRDGIRIVILLCPVYMFNSIWFGGVALYRVVAWNTGDELISYVKSNGFIFF